MTSRKRQKQERRAMLDALAAVGVTGKEAANIADGILECERIRRKLRSDAALARKIYKLTNGGAK